MQTGLKPALDELIADLPKLAPLFKELGEALGVLFSGLSKRPRAQSKELKAPAKASANGPLKRPTTSCISDQGWGAYERLTTNPAGQAKTAEDKQLAQGSHDALKTIVDILQGAVAD
jgi:hypothetical protein